MPVQRKMASSWKSGGMWWNVICLFLARAGGVGQGGRKYRITCAGLDRRAHLVG